MKRTFVCNERYKRKSFGENLWEPFGETNSIKTNRITNENHIENEMQCGENSSPLI